MNCKKCGGKTKVTKVVQSGDLTVRYRKCKKCGHSFKTVEE